MDFQCFSWCRIDSTTPSIPFKKQLPSPNLDLIDNKKYIEVISFEEILPWSTSGSNVRYLWIRYAQSIQIPTSLLPKTGELLASTIFFPLSKRRANETDLPNKFRALFKSRPMAVINVVLKLWIILHIKTSKFKKLFRRFDRSSATGPPYYFILVVLVSRNLKKNDILLGRDVTRAYD